MAKLANNLSKLAIPLQIVLTAAVQASASGTLYVDDDAPLGGNGTSWDTAYKFLQDAITDAVGGGTSEIHIVR